MKSELSILLEDIQELTEFITNNSNPNGTLKFELNQGKLGILYAKLQIEKSIAAFQQLSD